MSGKQRVDSMVLHQVTVKDMSLGIVEILSTEEEMQGEIRCI